MRINLKWILAGMLCWTTTMAYAQQPPSESPHEGCPMHRAVPAVDFQSVKICYAPMLQAFVAIDSVECAVHMVAMVGNQLDTIGSYQTDDIHKRHDLKKILRPVSVGTLGDYVVVLATSATDSSYIAFLDREMKVVARRDFACSLYAMHFEHGQVMLVGRNPYGYDIQVLPLHGGFDVFLQAQPLDYHYRVAKQAEKIKQSDPVGIGLSAVAVAVVFLALICICLMLYGSGALMSRFGQGKKKGATVEGKSQRVARGDANGELMAAIATAIHLYNDELHDEENTVITLQKVEREWTPWNAKYFNMNHYFNSNKR